MPDRNPLLFWFEDITQGESERVGDKAASLGEIHRELAADGIRVPPGFATTVAAHRLFVGGRLPAAVWTGLDEPAPGARALGRIPPGATLGEAMRICFARVSNDDPQEFQERCALARHLVESMPIPEQVRDALVLGYARLCDVLGHDADVAVRSSAASEAASVACLEGHLDAFLNVRCEDGVLHYWKQCVASLYTDRAISCQLDSGFDTGDVSMAVVVMAMVRSDSAASGAMCTVDPSSGHQGVIRVASSYGLGGLVATGEVSADEFTLWKHGLDEGRPAIIHRRMGEKINRLIHARGRQAGTEVAKVTLRERKGLSISSEEVMQLGRMGVAIERHFSCPMDIAWAKDERSGELFVVRVRPCKSVTPPQDRLELDTRLELDLGFEAEPLRDSLLPSDGVGLARLEHALTSEIGIHPLALVFLNELKTYADGGDVLPQLEPYADQLQAEAPGALRATIRAIEERTIGYMDKRAFFVDLVKARAALICAAFYPRPVMLRLPDLEAGEYQRLEAGRLFEPRQTSLAIGRRGASRLIDSHFRPVFAMVCQALREVHAELGLDNLQIMAPCCRTPEEGAHLRRLLDEEAVSPDSGIPLFLKLELPANVIEGRRFIDAMGLSGGSIATGPLVRATYGLSKCDPDGQNHGAYANSAAAKQLIRQAVGTWREARIKIGICGRAPFHFSEELLSFLVECGVSSISVQPEELLAMREALEQAEAKSGLRDQPRLKLNDKYAELERLSRKQRE